MRTAPLSRWPKRIARAASGFVLVIGVVVLLGWSFDVAALKSILPGLPRMSAITALAFALAGIALWCIATESRELLAGNVADRSRGVKGWLWRSCAGVAVALGAMRLSAYLLGWDFGWDTLGFREAAVNSSPARMSPAAATDFIVLGCGLLLVRTTRFARTLQPLALLGGLIGWLGLSHYLYGGQPLLPYSQMAVHTAVSFLLLSAGILATRPDYGLVALLISDSAGGAMARRLVPSALVFPFVFGWLRLAGQRAGWFGTEAGVALFALSNVLVFGGLVWANAALLHRADSERTQAEGKVRAQLERLNLLQQITQAIGGRQDLRSINQVVLRSLEDNLAFDFCCMCDYDPARQELIVLHIGVSGEALALELALTEQAHISADGNGLGRCVGGQLVYEPDIAEVKMPFPQKLALAGLRSLVLAPLRVESKVFGVLVAARREHHSFSSGECEFLRQLSEHVALAAHQAELYSALQHAYDDLRQTQQVVMQQERLRALGQMASGIAHDINNAISPVSLYTELLLEREVNLSAEGRKQLETVQRAVSDVAHTVARMREFYRQRETELALTPVDMNLLVRQVKDMTRARWSDMPQKRGVAIDMRIELAADPPAVMGIESEIREALINLIFNAVDAMPSGGALTVRTRVTQDPPSSPGAAGLRNVHVEVTDTGLGMDEETRARCREPFFTTKGERGTGLGLAMVHGMVRRHGADMEIESAVGAGTTLRMSFAATSAAGGGTAEPEVVQRVRSRLRILVVDDDPLVVRSLRETLEADGHVVVAANGGQTGIDTFCAAQEIGETFDIVLTDLGMPYVDGRKVASAVKTASPSTPVVMLTGWGQRLVAEGDIPPHVDRVLNKPPKLRELREALTLCVPGERQAELRDLGRSKVPA